VSAETAERDACRIEHYLSEETMARIAAVAEGRNAADGASEARGRQPPQ
jgi:Mn-dependent DtxR family transcriptional regulator